MHVRVAFRFHVRVRVRVRVRVNVRVRVHVRVGVRVWGGKKNRTAPRVYIATVIM